jgi:peroxiredoxin Q/BCP
MAKRKATVGRTKRVKTARRSSPRKKIARKKTARTVKRVKRVKRMPKKKVARKAARRTVRKKVARKAVKKARKVVKAKRGVSIAAAKPKRPRRTKQALPPEKPVATPVMEAEPLSSKAPSRVLEAPSKPPLEAEVIGAAPYQTLGVGDLAPDFQLTDEMGQTHTLSRYRGKKVVLYFYPKDDSSGCTAEACGFRNSLGTFMDRDAVVLGVSPDSVESHQRFAQKYGLTFPLLSDPDHRVAERYGVWVEKERVGEKTMGIARTTFVIGADGRIAHVFHDVRPEGHDQEVLRALAP